MLTAADAAATTAIRRRRGTRDSNTLAAAAASAVAALRRLTFVRGLAMRRHEYSLVRSPNEHFRCEFRNENWI